MTATMTRPMNSIIEATETAPAIGFAPLRAPRADANVLLTAADESELETRAVERNQEFHATLRERLAVLDPQLVDADDVM